ncbi:MAG: hypothetical protein ACREGG_01360 [Candidatus Saccharimonadales bacterium]
MLIADAVAVVLLAFTGWQILSIADASETEVAKVMYSLTKGIGALTAFIFMAANVH